MQRLYLLPTLLGLLAVLGAAPAKSTDLYNGALGSTPIAQGWIYGGLPQGSLPTPTASGGATTLDTSASQEIQAGFSASQAGFLGSTAPVPALSRARAFTVTFTVQVQTEAHAGNNRAGFSVIALADDARGIELAFWQNEIWAQEGGSAKLFTHAEGAAFDTTSGLIAYELALRGDIYRLSSGGQLILSGPVRDYRAATGLLDPYETPSYLFFGDNTTSASASVRLSKIGVTQPLDRQVFLPLAQR